MSHTISTDKTWRDYITQAMKRHPPADNSTIEYRCQARSDVTSETERLSSEALRAVHPSQRESVLAALEAPSSSGERDLALSVISTNLGETYDMISCQVNQAVDYESECAAKTYASNICALQADISAITALLADATLAQDDESSLACLVSLQSSLAEIEALPIANLEKFEQKDVLDLKALHRKDLPEFINKALVDEAEGIHAFVRCVLNMQKTLPAKAWLDQKQQVVKILDAHPVRNKHNKAFWHTIKRVYVMYLDDITLRIKKKNRLERAYDRFEDIISVQKPHYCSPGLGT